MPFGHQIAVLHFVQFSTRLQDFLPRRKIHILGPGLLLRYIFCRLHYRLQPKKVKILELGVQAIYVFKRNQEYCSFPEWGELVAEI